MAQVQLQCRGVGAGLLLAYGWSTSKSLTHAGVHLALAQAYSINWSRKSARNWASVTLSLQALAHLGQAQAVWRATFCIASSSTVLSSILMPLSCANCNCARSSIRLLSTCRASSGVVARLIHCA